MTLFFGDGLQKEISDYVSSKQTLIALNKRSAQESREDSDARCRINPHLHHDVAAKLRCRGQEQYRCTVPGWLTFPFSEIKECKEVLSNDAVEWLAQEATLAAGGSCASWRLGFGGRGVASEHIHISS